MQVVLAVLGYPAMAIQWLMGLIMKLLIRWWLNWARRQAARALFPADFKVTLVSGFIPPRLRLTFSIKNGGASQIRIIGLLLHLYCLGGTTLLASVVAKTLEENPTLSVERPGLRSGETAQVEIIVIPPLWFWLQSDWRNFELRNSTASISTIWGNLNVEIAPSSIASDTAYAGGWVESWLKEVGIRR